MDDITLRMEIRKALRLELALRKQVLAADAARRVAESETRRQFALDAAQIGDWEMDLITNVATCSLRHDECFGYRAPVAVWDYDIFLAHVHPDDRAEVNRRFTIARDLGTLYDVEYRVRWPDGTLHWLLSRGRFYNDASAKPIRVAGIVIDMTERKLAQQKIDRLALMVEKVTTPVMTTDVVGLIEWVNGAFTTMTGYSADEVMGRKPGSFLQGPGSSPATIRIMRDAIAAQQGFEVDILNYRKDGAPFWQHVKADPVIDAGGHAHTYIAVQSDVTERKQLESLLWKHANYDALTGLPNRRLFWDRLSQEIRHARRTGKTVALLFVDLDRFKEINDLFGHKIGDLTLREVASRITACVRDTDTAARIGGDEFTVILSDLDSRPHPDTIARKLLDALSVQFDCQKTLLNLSASIGIALFPDDAANAEDLFKYADQAMYLAKSGGRDRFSYFTPAMQAQSQRRLHIGHDLRQALALAQMEVHFQPIVCLASGRIMKAEALLRWNHATLGQIDPAEFIPLAEELGIIHSIGEWVFHQALARVAEWSQAFARHLQVSVNKSAMQFVNHAGMRSWPQQLHDRGVDGNQITVEITEGVLLKDSKLVMDTLNEYRSAGMQVALDDFGTGYSSMAYLRKFSIDYLKIDQSFVRDIESPNSRTIAEAIIVMGHKMGLKIIAEGIETPQQRAILAAAGCDFGQGFLFSQAVPPEQFSRLLRKDRA